MSETSDQNGPADPAHFADQGSAAPQPPGPPARTRRKTRIVLVCLAACVVFLGAVAVGAYLYVNHLASGIHRVRVMLPEVPGGRPIGGMTVLVTSASEAGSSGLIMLMHFDAHDKRGGVVSIPPQTLVQVPGHGLKQIDTALGFGGPSLLVKTVEQLTHVQIDHYARIDFTGVSNLINVIGGVNVTVPKTTVAKASATQHKKTVTKEHTFHAGLNHLNWRHGRVLRAEPFDLPGLPGAATAEPAPGDPGQDGQRAYAHQSGDRGPRGSCRGRHADRGQRLHQRRGGGFCHPARQGGRQRFDLRDGAHVHRFGSGRSQVTRERSALGSDQA